MIALKGKAALVTGAGIRLGRAVSEALADHGCRMILHCNSSRKDADALARKILKKGGEASVLQADLSKPGAAKKLARDADKVYGGIDILINNASVFWPTALEDLSESELDAFYTVNLKAPFVLSSEIGRKMKARVIKPGQDVNAARGVILNIACLSALRAWKTHVPYSISKAGIVSMTQGFAKLLAPEVRVNAIAPGAVLPPDDMSAETRSKLREKIPLKQFGSPQDIVDAALYLLTAPFVTGHVLCVDGGRILQ